MITELYALDQELTERSMGNDVTFEIMEKSGDTWTTSFTLLPSQIVSESLEIDQSICDSDEIVIGGCIPSQLRLSVMNITQDLTGKRIVVKIRGLYRSEPLYPSTTLYPAEDLYPGYSIEQTDQYVLFAGDIISYKRSENKRFRRIVAFDRMYYASTVRCKQATYDYINTYWDSGSQVVPVDMKINNLLSHLRRKWKVTLPSNISTDFINYETTFSMNPVHFDKVVDKDFTPLQGLRWVCELNGAFWIEDMPTDLSGDNATPRNILLYNNQTVRHNINTYSKLDYEDYSVKGIRIAEFFASEGTRSLTIEKTPSQGYSVYSSDNGLTKSVNGVQQGAFSSIYDVVNNLKQTDRILGYVYEYRPFKASIFNRWWVQVGDRVKLPVNDDSLVNVQSIVFSRKVKGINSMKVTIEAKGLEVQGKEITSSD